MGVVFLVVSGGLLGWLAAITMRRDDAAGIGHNIAVGIGGAVFVGLVVNPLLGGGNLLAGNYPVSALLIPFLGSVAVLVGVNLLRRDKLPESDRAASATKRI